MSNQVFLPWKNSHAATSFPKIKGDSLLTAHENIRPILIVKSFAYPFDLLSFYSSYFWLWPIQSEKWGWWCWLKRREGIRICCSGWSKGAEIVSNVEQFFFTQRWCLFFGWIEKAKIFGFFYSVKSNLLTSFNTIKLNLFDNKLILTMLDDVNILLLAE